MYSFTKPKPKSILKEDTKLWLIFIGISSILYISFTIFLEIKAYYYKKESINFKSEIFNIEDKIDKLNLKKITILKEEKFYKDILTQNSLMKDKIKNLLDLIPDPITLNSISMDKNRLIIKGITPTKEIYNSFMLPPLESVFNKTETIFYQMPNGWYKFISKNYLKEQK